MALTKAQRERKELAAEILDKQGKDYEVWMDNLHQEVINESLPLIQKAIKQYNVKPQQQQRTGNQQTNQPNTRN